MNPEMKELLIQFTYKCFYLYKDDDYIFPYIAKTRKNGRRIYELHRLLLQHAGIPYIGGGHGPRIHDWRHTFAVRSFKQMIDHGMDMYVALPVLSTYLGHKTIYATERYIRLTLDLYPYIAEKYSQKFNSIVGKVAHLHETD